MTYPARSFDETHDDGHSLTIPETFSPAEFDRFFGLAPDGGLVSAAEQPRSVVE
jgi:hypothetical protein